MGYFKRRVDRGRARDLLRALHERGEAERPWEVVPDQPPRKPCFLRFASLEIHEGSQRRTGIFWIAYDVLDDPHVDPATASDIRAALDWFNTNLRVPRLRDERAVCLFKSSAAVCMQRAWDLMHGLRRAGVIVEMQSVVNPGRVVYEDELQVAVVPWADAELE